MLKCVFVSFVFVSKFKRTVMNENSPSIFVGKRYSSARCERSVERSQPPMRPPEWPYQITTIWYSCARATSQCSQCSSSWRQRCPLRWRKHDVSHGSGQEPGQKMLEKPMSRGSLPATQCFLHTKNSCTKSPIRKCTQSTCVEGICSKCQDPIGTVAKCK